MAHNLAVRPIFPVRNYIICVHICYIEMTVTLLMECMVKCLLICVTVFVSVLSQFEFGLHIGMVCFVG